MRRWMRKGIGTKRWLAVCAVVCFALPQARADEASRKAKVQELFTVMRLDHTMDQLLGSIQQQTNSMMRTMPGYDAMTPEQQKIVTEYQNKVSTLANTSIGWKAMEPDMVNLYASTYDEHEIDGLIAFYKSPVGQTMLDKTPELNAKSVQFTKQRAQTLQPQLRELMQQFSTQFAAASKVPPPAAGGSAPAPAASAPHK